MAPLTTRNGQPLRLMTVNRVPERAFKLVGQVAIDLKNSDEMLLEHVGNAASLEEVEGKVKETRPDVLMAASMWTTEGSARAFATGRQIMGNDLITHAIPTGMQVEKGPEFVVSYLKETLPRVVREGIERKSEGGDGSGEGKL